MLNGILLALPTFGILAHELGHAAVALRLTSGPVQVLVGRQSGLVRLSVGRLRVSIHLEPARGVGWSGLCVYKSSGVPNDELLITAAGPIASLLWAVLCTLSLAIWGPDLQTVGRIALAIGVVEGVIAFVYNGAAALLPELVSKRPRSDGAKIRHALQAQNGLRALETTIGRPITEPEMRNAARTGKLPEDVLRAKTSVPPPRAKSGTNG